MTDLITAMRCLFESGDMEPVRALTADERARIGEAAQRIANHSTAAYKGELALLKFERTVATAKKAGGYSY